MFRDAGTHHIEELARAMSPPEVLERVVACLLPFFCPHDLPSFCQSSGVKEDIVNRAIFSSRLGDTRERIDELDSRDVSMSSVVKRLFPSRIDMRIMPENLKKNSEVECPWEFPRDLLVASEFVTATKDSILVDLIRVIREKLVRFLNPLAICCVIPIVHFTTKKIYPVSFLSLTTHHNGRVVKTFAAGIDRGPSTFG